MKRGITRREFEVTDQAEILAILDKCKIVHIGLSDEGMPYVVPMNYGYEMKNGSLTLYLHGATQGYKLDVMKKNPNVFFEMECDVNAFDGNLPCQYGTSYTSLMGRGMAEILEDPQEKQDALTILMKSQTGKDFEFNERMVSVVSVIRIRVDSYTAKQRPLPLNMR